jgi:hypothetical protein
MKILYRFSEWHALAKLRMHTEDSLELMEERTKELGELLRQFRQFTCTKFGTVELQREADARVRRRMDVTTDMPNATLPQSRNALPTSVSPVTATGAGSWNCDQTVLSNQSPTSKFICCIDTKLIYMLRCRCGPFLTWTS